MIFAGRVPHEEVQRYYELIDVLAYPRRSMRLTELVTPLKPLEAMAQGRMFVASDVGGHRELVRDGETGFLLQAGDAAALAQRSNAVLDDEASWPRIAAQARQFVETERTWAKSVARYAGRVRERARIAPTACNRHGPGASDHVRHPRHPRPRPARRCRRRSSRAWAGSRAIAAPTTRASTSTARCAIGMRRLSIIDLAGGHQPLSNEDGTLWLVANGEIYNYRELRARADSARAIASHRLGLRDAAAPLRAARRRFRRAG